MRFRESFLRNYNMHDLIAFVTTERLTKWPRVDNGTIVLEDTDNMYYTIFR